MHDPYDDTREGLLEHIVLSVLFLVGLSLGAGAITYFWLSEGIKRSGGEYIMYAFVVGMIFVMIMRLIVLIKKYKQARR